MKKTLARAALAACFLGAVSVTALMSGPVAAANDDKPAAPKVTLAVGKPLIEAEKLLNAKDYAGALAKLKEAQAVPVRTPYDDYVINQVIAVIAVTQSDYATALATYQLMATSPAEPITDKMGTRHNLTLLEYQNKDFAKTLEYGQQLEAMNGLDINTATAMVESYYFTNDFAKAEALAQKWIDTQIAAKQQPNQNLLSVELSAQVKTNDQKGAAKTLELLAQYYSSPNDWDQLIDVALGTPGITNVEGLDLYRLRWTAAAMANGQDYSLMATIALQLGYPGEARTVLEQGIQMGKLSTQGSANTAFQQARSQAASDEKMIPAFAAEAEKSPNGEKLEKLAETYYGYSRFSESEAAVRAAIAKDGMRDPGQAKLLLAMDLINQNKYQDALATLQDVPAGSTARFQAVRLWTIFTQHKINEMAASAPAAPAAATPTQ